VPLKSSLRLTLLGSPVRLRRTIPPRSTAPFALAWERSARRTSAWAGPRSRAAEGTEERCRRLQRLLPLSASTSGMWRAPETQHVHISVICCHQLQHLNNQKRLMATLFDGLDRIVYHDETIAAELYDIVKLVP
jgi:hypothetical protein